EAAIDQVLLTQCEQVTAVRTLGRRGQAEQEPGLEVIDQAPIGCGRCVVELVDDDVVERARVESAQVFVAAQRLDRREQDVGVYVMCSFDARVEADRRVGANAPERRDRL